VDQARAELSALLELYAKAQREPLPLPCTTGHVYAATRSRGGEQAALARAAATWQSKYGGIPGDDADDAFVYVWGPKRPFDELLGQAPRPDESWSGESSRFGRLALRLWTPLLGSERLITG
jgi:exodeoxyribonuclease V gamma subunit